MMNLFILANIAILMFGFPGTEAQEGAVCDYYRNLCDINAECESLPGYSFTCKCKPNYAGNGRNCRWQSTLPEPCASNPCDLNAYCRNMGDSYNCSCIEDYTGDGKNCTLPCDSNPCHANATCTNLGFFHLCSCKEGYVGDGLSCIEYVEPPVNVKKASSDRTPRCSRWVLQDNQQYYQGNCGINRDVGDRCCVSCRSNYRFYGTSQKYFDISCRRQIDAEWSPSTIPRCEAISPCGSSPCHAKADCRDIRSATQPSYRCTCIQGYTGNGRYCTRVWAEWVEWSKCSRTCDGGSMTRTRSCIEPSSCVGSSYEEKLCNTELCPECSGEWTTWFDRDNPSGAGDYEDLYSIRKERKLDVCISPSLVDGRVVSIHTNWYHAENNLTVAPSTGLTCVNSNQKNGVPCKDYEVRFCCPKIKNREEVRFVGEMFYRTVLSISGGSSASISRRTDDAVESNCKPRSYSDSSNNIRMLGKDCKSGRRKRQTAPNITARDILFLIDESGSVGESHFKTFQRLAMAIVNSFCGDIDIGKNLTRVGVLSFDSTQHVQLTFDQTFDKALVLDEIEAISYNAETHSKTCLVSSLDYVRRSMFTPARGARIGEPGIEQVLILLTDGCANCGKSEERPRLLEAMADRLSQQDVAIITYFVGTGTCFNQMMHLMHGSDCYQAFSSENWDHLNYQIDQIEASICNKSWALSPPCPLPPP